MGARTRVGVEAEDRGCVETASLVLTVGPGNTVIVRVCHNTDYQTYPEKTNKSEQLNNVSVYQNYFFPPFFTAQSFHF